MSKLSSKSLSAKAYEFRFVHSSGPGGQHVNKTSTAVELRVNVAMLELDTYSLRRLKSLQANRINKEGFLVLQVSDQRSQLRNRQQAIERIEAMIVEALKRPKARVATRPTLASKRRRVDKKKRHASTKKQRQRPDW
ncbi:MAG: aminoacyl-tRNA hydrolase [Proteobacteria bacterium]|nr:aminoacyl-tRNA hydrolase [Pseudomonadota bacterium]